MCEYTIPTTPSSTSALRRNIFVLNKIHTMSISLYKNECHCCMANHLFLKLPYPTVMKYMSRQTKHC